MCWSFEKNVFTSFHLVNGYRLCWGATVSNSQNM
jgi:hypothetical protein